MSVELRNRQPRKSSGLRVDTRLLKAFAIQALDLAGIGNHNLSIVLVNDDLIAKLNAQYHATEDPTDILTFDYGDGQGEIVISLERAVSQAKQFRSTPARELALYVVHGILHLRGFDDRTPRQRQRMRAAERRLLNRVARSVHLRDLVRQ